MGHDVFISHTSADRPVAEAICRRLESCGLHCWLAPRNIALGAVWGAAIAEAIRRCKVMVVIISEQSQRSQQVVREVERAVARQMLIMPVRIDDVPLTGALEYFLSHAQWLDAFPAPLDDYLTALGDSVQRCLGEDSPAENMRVEDKQRSTFNTSNGAGERLHPDLWGRQRRSGFLARLSAIFDDH